MIDETINDFFDKMRHRSYTVVYKELVRFIMTGDRIKYGVSGSNYDFEDIESFLNAIYEFAPEYQGLLELSSDTGVRENSELLDLNNLFYIPKYNEFFTSVIKLIEITKYLYIINLLNSKGRISEIDTSLIYNNDRFLYKAMSSLVDIERMIYSTEDETYDKQIYNLNLKFQMYVNKTKYLMQKYYKDKNHRDPLFNTMILMRSDFKIIRDLEHCENSIDRIQIIHEQREKVFRWLNTDIVRQINKTEIEIFKNVV